MPTEIRRVTLIIRQDTDEDGQCHDSTCVAELVAEVIEDRLGRGENALELRSIEVECLQGEPDFYQAAWNQREERVLFTLNARERHPSWEQSK
jgi:hypothetical protein